MRGLCFVGDSFLRAFSVDTISKFLSLGGGVLLAIVVVWMFLLGV